MLASSPLSLINSSIQGPLCEHAQSPHQEYYPVLLAGTSFFAKRPLKRCLASFGSVLSEATSLIDFHHAPALAIKPPTVLGSKQSPRQMGHSCSSIALSFEHLETIDVSFDRSSAGRQRQSCHNGCLVPFQSMGKLLDFPHSRCLDALQPGLQLVSLKLADQDEKLLNQQLDLSYFTVGLTNER